MIDRPGAVITTHQAELLELFETETGNGPCSDCFRSGTAVHRADLQALPQRWPARGYRRPMERASSSGRCREPAAGTGCLSWRNR